MMRLIAPSKLYWIALAAIFFASPGNADELPHFSCPDCRDISEFPEDARNDSVNRIFGRDSSLGFDETRFRLSDSYGNTITVDINARYVLDPFDYRLIDELFVEDILIQIVLAYPNGDILRFTYPRSLLDPNGSLPVPANALQVPPPSLPEDDLPGDDPLDDLWDDPRDDWDFRDENWADWEEAWGGWHCRPDYSSPYVTGVICRQG